MICKFMVLSQTPSLPVILALRLMLSGTYYAKTMHNWPGPSIISNLVNSWQSPIWSTCSAIVGTDTEATLGDNLPSTAISQPEYTVFIYTLLFLCLNKE